MDPVDLLNDFDAMLPFLASAYAELGAEEEEEENEALQSIRNGQPGDEYLTNLLEGHPKRIYEVLRMQKPTFLALCGWLEEHTNVASSRYVDIKEQVAMFLFTMNFAASNREVCERFQRGNATVSRSFNSVLAGMMELYNHVVKLPSENTPPSTRICDNPKYKYFVDCIGALDGTHVPAHVSEDVQARYRNRKKDLSQNVMACCDMDMRFSYLLSGWEGSAHDMAVFRDAKLKHGFRTPKGKYWLADAGYSNSDGLLVPYRGTRYHLREQRLAARGGGGRPENAKELFNLRHSSLRNAIERIFGVVKRKYKILRLAPEYPVKTQARIVLACAAIHNFVKTEEGNDADRFLSTRTNRRPRDTTPPVTYPSSDNEVSSQDMETFRDQLAGKMWADYVRYIRNGGSRIIDIDEDDDEPDEEEENEIRRRELNFADREEDSDIEML